MGSGEYKYKWTNGREAVWLLLADGRIQYWCEGNLEFTIRRPFWHEIVEAMSSEPIRTDDLPVVGEILAWRLWRIEKDYLMAVYQDVLWLHDEPMFGYISENSKSGVYAFKTKAHALSLMASIKDKKNLVLGSVKLYGNVIEHENGYKAEYAKVVSIDTARDKSAVDQLDNIRKWYKVAGEGHSFINDDTPIVKPVTPESIDFTAHKRNKKAFDKAMKRLGYIGVGVFGFGTGMSFASIIHHLFR